MRSRLVLVTVAAALLAAGCGGDDPEGAAERGGAEPTRLSVFAAASLTDVFQEIGDSFERDHDVTVEFNFLSSAEIAEQIQQGAPADVFASADEPNMQKIVDAGLVDGQPQVFTRNLLEIVVPAGNPQKIEGLADLEDPELVISICNEETPVGRYALEAFDKAGVEVQPDSLEADVKAVVNRVEVGEADAGIVYTTDVKAAEPDVAGVPIPERQNVVAAYPIAAIKDGARPARDFVEFALSDEGQRVLEKHGFLPI